MCASMAQNGFSITSPHFERLARGMARTDINEVTRKAAVEVAGRLVKPLQDAIVSAGGSTGLARAIGVHDHHTNELVMRDRGNAGDVIVGVDGSSRYADEAEELEWGSIDAAPRPWVRTTYAQKARDVYTMWSNELTRELDRSVLR